MRKPYVVLTTLVSLFCVSGVTLGGIGTLTGKNREMWEKGGLSVILAQVRDVTAVDAGGERLYRATLVPNATLAGNFDPSLSRSVKVRFFVSSMTSSIREVPAEGATVLAVIRVGIRHADEQELSNWIVSDLCTFMPDRSALVALTGLDDDRVLATLRKLQEARENSDPNPYTGATTRPAKSSAAE